MKCVNLRSSLDQCMPIKYNEYHICRMNTYFQLAYSRYISARHEKIILSSKARARTPVAEIATNPLQKSQMRQPGQERATNIS